MREILVKINVRKKSDIEFFEEILNRHFKPVLCTGIRENDRPPMPDGYRAFFTCFMEDEPR